MLLQGRLNGEPVDLQARWTVMLQGPLHVVVCLTLPVGPILMQLRSPFQGRYFKRAYCVCVCACACVRACVHARGVFWGSAVMFAHELHSLLNECDTSYESC